MIRILNLEKAINIVKKLLVDANGNDVFACLEAPAPLPLNGAFSQQQIGLSLVTCATLRRLSVGHVGYMYGAWHGVLTSNGIPVEIVYPSQWKRPFNLYGKKKEGSIELAKRLFPLAEDQLR